MSLSHFSVPAPTASQILLRYSSLPRCDDFKPQDWPNAPLKRDDKGWWHIDLQPLRLAPGTYEYEYLVQVDGQWKPVADPYAEELTKLSGYRGLFHIRDFERVRLPFLWGNDMPPSGRLSENNEIVIYELPMRWVDGDLDRDVGLGTFERATFERLDGLAKLGINCIELLPVQDSMDTLNWGYGTRFFFAPDWDLGSAFDLKLFIKRCHQRGIRVILDLVMNHARGCPLADLAPDWYFLRDPREELDPNGDPRPGWGGAPFRYRRPVDGDFPARKLQFDVAEYLIREYHVDGFRLDEFKGIDNYQFVQEFKEHAHSVHRQAFPDRPFIVIAEDSWRRREITWPVYQGRTVVDSMWDFDFRDDVRRLVSNRLSTNLGQASRSERVKWLIGLHGYSDMTSRVTYCTSHDVERDDEQRMLSYYYEVLGESFSRPPLVEPKMQVACEQVASTFAFTLTAAGIPMFLAGEEFADLHDTDHSDWRRKMSDPVDWWREDEMYHSAVRKRVADMIKLRASHPALQRNEVEFFGFGPTRFHPEFDLEVGARLFAYCRNAGQPLGSPGQVIVVANTGGVDYPQFEMEWPWGGRAVSECAPTSQPLPQVAGSVARLALRPFQARVFAV